MKIPDRARVAAMALLVAVSTIAVMMAALTWMDRRLESTGFRRFDLLLQTRIHALTSPGLTGVMLALTFLGAIKIFATALALAIVWLALAGRRREAAVLGGAISSAFVLNETLKEHFHRARPQVPWSIGDEHTFSFPSGHSLFSVVLYGSLAYLALRPDTSAGRRLGVLLPAMMMPMGIGISRIYLGMHYPTDVLAGWFAGALWLGAVVTIDRAWGAPSYAPEDS